MTAPTAIDYEATPSGVEHFERWLRASTSTPPVREELLAKVAFCRPSDLPRMVEIVRDAELACTARLNELNARMREERLRAGDDAWRRLMTLIVTAGDVAWWDARIKWLQDLRRYLQREGQHYEAQHGPFSTAALTMPVLSLADLSLTFRRGSRHLVSVLAGVDLTVEAGEVVAVLAQRAQGKTSLLRVAAGMLRPNHGRVLLAGQDIWSLSARRRARLLGGEIGWVGHAAPDLDVPMLDERRVAAAWELRQARGLRARAGCAGPRRCARLRRAAVGQPRGLGARARLARTRHRGRAPPAAGR